jgi:hypothetical protein
MPRKCEVSEKTQMTHVVFQNSFVIGRFALSGGEIGKARQARAAEK